MTEPQKVFVVSYTPKGRDADTITNAFSDREAALDAFFAINKAKPRGGEVTLWALEIDKLRDWGLGQQMELKP